MKAELKRQIIFQKIQEAQLKSQLKSMNENIEQGNSSLTLIWKRGCSFLAAFAAPMTYLQKVSSSLSEAITSVRADGEILKDVILEGIEVFSSQNTETQKFGQGMTDWLCDFFSVAKDTTGGVISDEL